MGPDHFGSRTLRRASRASRRASAPRRNLNDPRGGHPGVFTHIEPGRNADPAAVVDPTGRAHARSLPLQYPEVLQPSRPGDGRQEPPLLPPAPGVPKWPLYPEAARPVRTLSLPQRAFLTTIVHRPTPKTTLRIPAAEGVSERAMNSLSEVGLEVVSSPPTLPSGGLIAPRRCSGQTGACETQEAETMMTYRHSCWMLTGVLAITASAMRPVLIKRRGVL